MNADRRYVLITPAKDEEAFLGETIASMIRQTLTPVEWVIVSDGSTDRTDEMVQAAAQDHPWIRLLRMPPRAHRSFAAIVHATEAGLRALTVHDHCYVGLLDSDVRFQEDYFERVIATFESSPRLGLAGGVVIDVGLARDRFPRNREDVPGAVQFFRRRCFEDLGALLAIPEGGWDALTCARARMCGYESRLLTELVVDHLKPRNSAEGGIFRRNWQLGLRDHALGYHPLIEALKCLDRLVEFPPLVGSVARAGGFGWAALRRRPRTISDDLLGFIRAEHLSRLRQTLGLKRTSAAGTVLPKGATPPQP